MYSNQRDGNDKNAGNAQTTAEGGRTGHNNKGRVDYPLTPEASKKLVEEAPLWRNKTSCRWLKNFKCSACNILS